MSDPSSLTVSLTLQAEAVLPEGIGEASLDSLAKASLAAEGARGAWELSVLFTDDAGIRDLHRQFMDLDSPTDIMTFPYEPAEFVGTGGYVDGGDIVISVDTAAANATEAGWRVRDELEFLLLHGVLHLLGWDDHTEQERVRMLARQSELLGAWRAAEGQDFA